MTEKETEKPKERKDAGNIIYVGEKHLFNYVTAVLMQFTTKKTDEVIIKARGKFTARAIDIALISKEQMLNDKVEITDIKINSEKFTTKEGKDIKVSSIEITLKKLKK